MNLLEIQQFVKKIAEKFPEEEDALDILARLTEECGEVASEIRKMEKDLEELEKLVGLK